LSRLQRASSITVRLFSRMAVPSPWIIQNVTAIYFQTSGAGATVIMNRPAPGTVGQTRNAYRDITVSGSSDPGGRIIEFLVRFKF